MPTIQNPILRGFNPDPCILRVGDDFYIATSTFEWFPGVQIHHSRDLVHWRLLTRPLTRLSQLDMLGDPDSGGVWAPCLSHDGEKFWLVYTDVKNMPWNSAPDLHNYVVTAPAITGPWSEPVYLNSSGFDPSLFHDDDGRKWIVNMRWDHRDGRTQFNGILLQEFDAAAGKLTGPIRRVFAGSPIGATEGPHLYKRGGWYYLVTAEGGTGYEHAVTVARSRSIEGPYEIAPDNPILTGADNPDLALQKNGHASFVETQNGDWYLAHLTGRPMNWPDVPERRCPLGRETALQKLTWDADGWPRLAQGGHWPAVEVPAPELPPHPWPETTLPGREDFSGEKIRADWQSLRRPMDDTWLSLSARPGWLRLMGMESPGSLFRQSLIGRRLQAFEAQAATHVEFAPEDFQQFAGLALWYHTRLFTMLQVTHDEKIGRCLTLMRVIDGRRSEPQHWLEPLPDGGVTLGLLIENGRYRFRRRDADARWQWCGPWFDLGEISDEVGRGFTGAFITLSAHDLTGRRLPADFQWFDYAEGTKARAED